MFEVLVVEDSEACRKVIETALSSDIIQTTCRASIKDARELMAKKNFDLVILDFGLPDGSGLLFLDQLKKDKKFEDLPIFALTGQEDMESKVSAFNLGVDDYLVKPVSSIELKARVEMRLFKESRRKRSLDSVTKGKLTLHIPLMKAVIQEEDFRQRQVDLTAKEFKILAFLAQNEGRIFSRNDLVKSIWGDQTHVVARTVDSHICGARKKLGLAADYIECIPGSGYRFTAEAKGSH